jgi:hypothetical protein
MLTTRRRDQHSAHISRITERALYYYNARPHPSEIASADAELKRGIDEDWKASVQRYPEVLEYFYGLVSLDLPGDEEPGVRDPPLSALGGGMGRKVRVREPVVEGRRRRREERPVAPMVPPGRVPSRGGGGVGFAPPGYGYVPSGAWWGVYWRYQGPTVEIEDGKERRVAVWLLICLIRYTFSSSIYETEVIEIGRVGYMGCIGIA